MQDILKKDDRPLSSDLSQVHIVETVSFAAKVGKFVQKVTKGSKLGFAFAVGCLSCASSAYADQAFAFINQDSPEMVAQKSYYLSSPVHYLSLVSQQSGSFFDAKKAKALQAKWAGNMVSLSVERNKLQALEEIDALLQESQQSWEQHVQNAMPKTGPKVAADDVFKGGSILDLIAHAEAKGNYNAYFRNTQNSRIKFTEMTLSQVMHWQKRYIAKGHRSSAVGRYQFILPTLKLLKKTLKLTGKEKFTPVLQDQLAVALLKRRGLDAWQEGRLSTKRFAHNISKEWASFPSMYGANRGKSYYHQPGFNEAKVKINSVMASLDVVDARLEQEFEMVEFEKNSAFPIIDSRPQFELAYDHSKYQAELKQTQLLASIAMQIGAEPVANVDFPTHWDKNKQSFFEIDRVQLNLLNAIATHEGFDGEYGYNYQSSPQHINQLKTKLYYKIAGGEKMGVGALPAAQDDFWSDRERTDQLQLFLVSNWARQITSPRGTTPIMTAAMPTTSVLPPLQARISDFKGYKAKLLRD